MTLSRSVKKLPGNRNSLPASDSNCQTTGRSWLLEPDGKNVPCAAHWKEAEKQQPLLKWPSNFAVRPQQLKQPVCMKLGSLLSVSVYNGRTGGQ